MNTFRIVGVVGILLAGLLGIGVALADGPNLANENGNLQLGDLSNWPIAQTGWAYTLNCGLGVTNCLQFNRTNSGGTSVGSKACYQLEDYDFGTWGASPTIKVATDYYVILNGDPNSSGKITLNEYTGAGVFVTATDVFSLDDTEAGAYVHDSGNVVLDSTTRQIELCASNQVAPGEQRKIRYHLFVEKVKDP